MKLKYVILLVCSYISISFARLDNILLIINYNFPHYESIPLLTEIYSRYFKHIVFYGPQADLHVIHFEHNRGYLSYACIADAMERYPDMEGYLFLMDDCILNAWHMKNLDTSKIWYPEIGFMYCHRGHSINVTKGLSATNWQWWNTQWGCDAITVAFDEIPQVYKKMLERNRGKSTVIAAFSDIVYIPQRFKNDFIFLANIFYRNNAFLESSVPTIMSCLVPESEWIWLQGHGVDRDKHYKDYKESCYFNHPIKLSYSKNRKFVQNLFERMK